MSQDKIEGRNPVTEAIKSGREIDKLLVSAKEGSIKKIVAMAKERGIVVQEVVKSKLDELSDTGAHQGVIALVAVIAVRTAVAVILLVRRDREDREAAERARAAAESKNKRSYYEKYR